jgi:hypothetical protein
VIFLGGNAELAIGGRHGVADLPANTMKNVVEDVAGKQIACSFARRIDPLRLTLPPLPGDRSDPVVRSLESQIYELFVELPEAAPLLAGFCCICLEPA